MNDRLEKLLRYLAEQGKQPSTWRGLIGVVTGLTAWNVSPEKAAAIITVGIFAAGLVGALFPDRVKPKEPDTKGTP